MLLADKTATECRPLSPVQVSYLMRAITLLSLFGFWVIALAADGSSENSIVNTILKGSKDKTSFPHPMDPTIEIAVLGDCEVCAMTINGTWTTPSCHQGIMNPQMCVCVLLCAKQHVTKAFANNIRKATNKEDTKGSRRIPVACIDNAGNRVFEIANINAAVELVKYKQR